MTKVNDYRESELIFAEKSKSKKFQDLTSLRFNRLLVIGYAGRRDEKSWWFCKCDCGKVVRVWANAIKRGTTKSCGCFIAEKRFKHGYAADGNIHRVYKVWSSMVDRCINPNNKRYSSYGGRGISVCDRWRRFDNFIFDMGEAGDGMSIERIDNNKGYCPENCKWGTHKEQANNKRSNRIIEFNGESMNMSQWAEKIGISYSVLSSRINDGGWSIEMALMTPVKHRKKI